MMTPDVELLRRYVEDKSEAAFAELVNRRIGLVYALALRQADNLPAVAEAATHQAFWELARQAPSLLTRTCLAGWLFETAHRAADDLVRAERQRRFREQRGEHKPEASAPVTAAEKTRQLLDEAFLTLTSEDRDALALRCFEARASADIARIQRISEDAARKRVEQALDLLASALASRGTASNPAAVSLMLSEQTTATAPAGLAANVTGTALAGAKLSGRRTTASFFGSPWTTAAMTLVAVIACGLAAYEASRARTSEVRLATAQRELGQLRTSISAQRQQLDSAEQRARAAEDDNARLLAAIDAARRSRVLPAASAPADPAAGTTPPATATTNAPAAESTPPAETTAATTEPQVHLRLIQLRRREGDTDQTLLEQATAIINRVKAGESFAELAQQFSVDARRSRGGDWGWLKRSDFKAPFADVAMNLAKGEVATPLVLPEGCFILYAEDRR